MKNVYEVLRQKEMELTRLEKEVEALRLVAPLLSEEKEGISEVAKPALATAVGGGPQSAPSRIPTPSTPSIPAPQPVRAAGWDDSAKRWP
jgi:O-acetyl-ADP-ribose deacetylase (regulator of RNase III)